MLKLIITGYEIQNIDIIRNMSILCCQGYSDVHFEADKIIVNINSDLYQLDEMSQAHSVARKLQKYGSVHMECDYPRVDRI